MPRQFFLRNFMVRRLALGCPYSKPSTATAEDGLRTRQVDRASPDSSRLVYPRRKLLRNAPTRSSTVCFALRGFALRFDPIQRSDRNQSISAVKAALAANWLQQEKPKHMFLEETARARAIRILETTSPAVDFFEQPAPRGWAHDYDSPDRSVLTPSDKPNC